MKVIRKVLGEKVYTKIWKRSHDATERIQTLDELYCNVPKELKDKKVYVTELHQFDESDKKSILAWLNREQ